MNYKDYLKSNHWVAKKKEYFSQRKYRCYFCGKRRGLCLHHITYKNIGKELIEDLIYLCKNCHEYLHQGFERAKIDAWLKRARTRNISKGNKKVTLVERERRRKQHWRNYYKRRYKFPKRQKIKGIFN